MDAFGVPRSPSEFDIDAAIQEDHDMLHGHEQEPPEDILDVSEEESVATSNTQNQNQDWVTDWAALNGQSTSPTSPTRKRKSRAQLESVPAWMPTFIPPVMEYLVNTEKSKLPEDTLKKIIREHFEMMPSEGQQQPGVNDVVRAFTKSRTSVPSCRDACQTISNIVGHLVRNPSSVPFVDDAEHRAKAEADYEKLDSAWRVVGKGMDDRFAEARTTFLNAIFSRTSCELPAMLLTAASAKSTTPPTKHAVISMPSFMTPVCAGLHNVGNDRALPISTTFDLVRCCGGLNKHPPITRPYLPYPSPHFVCVRVTHWASPANLLAISSPSLVNSWTVF